MKNKQWGRMGLAGAALCVAIAGPVGDCSGAVLQGQIAAHDPSRIVPCNGRYYVYATGANIQTRVSTDLIHWGNGPDVLAANDSVNGVPQWARSASPGNTGNVVWAPDVIFFNGLYHMYWAFSTFGSANSVIGLETTPTLDPSAAGYHWADQGLVVGSHAGGGGPNCIDPCPVYDAGGNLWLSFGSYNNYGIGLIRLDNTTGLRSATDTTVTQIAKGDIEASYIQYHAGFYYLFYNIGSCCQGASSTYHILMGRSASITGPYVDKNGVSLLNGGGSPFLNSIGNKIGPGHVGIYSDGTIDRLTYHLESDGDNHGESTLNLQTLVWGADGWPVAGSDLAAGTYRIVSKSSKLAMGVAGGSPSDGALLDQDLYGGGGAQQWRVAATTGGTTQSGNDGYDRMTSVGDGEVVDLYFCNSADGTPIDQYPWFNNDCQRWWIEQTSDGYYRLASKGGGGVISVTGASTTPGTALDETTWTGADSQKWSFFVPAAVQAGAAARALRIAAGLIDSDSGDSGLDLVTTSPSDGGRIDIADAAALLRRAAGVDPNP